MKLRILFLLLFGFICQLTYAQSNRPEPVKWSFESEKVGDDTYLLKFVADIEEKWHVYSQFIKEGGPVATSITFDNALEFQPLGISEEIGDKHEGFDKLFEMDIIDFEHKMTIQQKVKMNKDVSEIMGFVTFMTCNGETCLPPNDIPFIIHLN